MMTLIRLELARVIRDRVFWFWALIGVPVLLPALVLLLSFALASGGVAEPQTVRADIATTVDDETLLASLADAGVPGETFDTREAVIDSIRSGEFSVGLVDVDQTPGQPFRATLLAGAGGRELNTYQSLERFLHTLARDRRNALIDDLHFDGPSFDLLMEPIAVARERVPDRLEGGLLQIVVLIWAAILLCPYLLLSWNSGSRAVTDRTSGYLSTLVSSRMPTWQWLVVRWAALSVVAGALLLYFAVLFSLYMRAFGTLADWLVAEGILVGLSEETGIAVQAYLVDAVRIWRETSFLSFSLWIVVAILQLSAVAGVFLWVSVAAATLRQYRLFKLAPFSLVFLLPLMGLGALGRGMNAGAWIPGLNTVLAIEPTVSGSLPGVAFFASAGAAVLVSIFLVAFSLTFANLSMRSERLWSV